MHPAGPLELRRGLLAVSVLHDVDLEPAVDGVVLAGCPPIGISWEECRRALLGHDPESDLGRLRLLRWLQARRLAACLPAEALQDLLVVAGLPRGHDVHPGRDWVHEQVLGGALDLGLGAQGLDPADPDGVVLLPPPALATAELDPVLVWPAARSRLERLGAVAAERFRLDASGVLRPAGSADVVTLLGARTLRAAVAGAAGGLGVAVVPMRRRGWTRLQLVDPVFGPAAAAATAAADRAFPRPLLVTVDEVTVVPEAGPARRLWLHDQRGERSAPSGSTCGSSRDTVSTTRRATS